jgi:hypothetical protein
VAALATAPTRAQIRARFISSLHPRQADYIRATDALEVAVRVHVSSGAVLPPGIRAAFFQVVQARDAFLNPLMEAEA